MKKTLLIGAALMIGFAGYSQNAKINRISSKGYNKFAAKKTNKETPASGSIATTAQRNSSSNNSVNSACNTNAHVSSAYTSAGFFDWIGVGNASYRNVLTYNKDLNTVAFIHRASADWKVETVGTPTIGTGCIMATWFPAGNPAASDSMVIFNTLPTPAAGFHSARYPTGTLFNPPTNTVVANAYLYASGIYTPDGTNYNAGSYYAARQPKDRTITGILPTNNQNISASAGAPFGSVGGYIFSDGTIYTGALDNDAQQAGNKVVSCGPLYDGSLPAGNINKGCVVAVGTYSAGGLVWSADSITAGFYLTSSSVNDPTTGDGYIGDIRTRVAFSADGMTGYVVMNGRLATTYTNSADSMVSPNVWKTTDGGAHWNQVLAGYDWNTGHPELMRGVGILAHDSAVFSAPAKNFQVNDDPNGYDLTVDANGVLHYVVTVQEVFNDGKYADSLGFAYINVTHYDYVNHRPMIWDLMTDGTCWKTLLVDSINTCYISANTSTDPTNAHSRWAINGTASSNEGIGANITVSRSTDGTVIFYGWADSNPTGDAAGVPATSTFYNTDPDLIMKAYDVNANTMSAKKDITNQAENVYNPYLSDISYFDDTQSAWVVPAVFLQDGRVSAGVNDLSEPMYDINSASDYHYIDCGTFTASEIAAVPISIYPDMITSSCTFAYAIKANNNFESSINNYPNPFNGTTTIAVNLSENKAFNINVYNAIGNLVFSKKTNGNVGENAVTFDGSALSSGIYYYTVTAGNQQATKKMVIQK